MRFPSIGTHRRLRRDRRAQVRTVLVLPVVRAVRRLCDMRLMPAR